MHAANLATRANFMDAIFLLGEEDRATFLQHLMQAFGCSYICLWSYLPQPSNCLLCLDGLYRNLANQPSSSSSSGSIAHQSLFHQYKQALFNVDNGCVPGLAFKNHLPYMELKFADLQRLACIEVQLQFYQEAGIKIAVFMGCNKGEIEFGMPNDTKVNLQMEMRQWFAEDFNGLGAPRELPLPACPHQQAIEALTQIRNIQCPSIDSEDAALTQALIAVISSPSSSSSSRQTQQNSSPNCQKANYANAFQSYRSAALASAVRTQRPNMFKRAIKFYTSLNLMRSQEQVRGSRPTSTYQLRHMISERRRREQHNESFQALRSLLPPGTKKDKASVLATTTEYLTSLKAQVAELRERNQMLEAQLLPQKEGTEEGNVVIAVTERVDVRVTPVAAAASTSKEATMVDLQVVIRGQSTMLDLVNGVLEFLKQVNNVNLKSLNANTNMVESTSLNHMILRLRIEEGQWDEVAFQEAIKRIVDDLTH